MKKLFVAPLAPGVLLLFLTFVLYVRTLAPDVVDADGGEFQFAAWNFSLVHPTGYPLYLILGGLFQHILPVGNPAYRLNLFTALTAALAVGAVYLAVHALTRSRLAAFVATASLALSRTFWFDASAAEVYDLNAFFVALLIWLAMRWQTQPTAVRFSAFCFAFGLSLTHHRSIILWIPAFALFFIFIAVPNLKSRLSNLKSYPPLAGYGLLLFCIPLLLYLYVPLRAASSPYATLPLAPGSALQVFDTSPAGLTNYLLGRVFQFELGWDAVSTARLAAVPGLLLEQLLPVGILFALAGFLSMVARRDWARLWLLAFGAVATVIFASIYHIGDIAHYYIPLYLVCALWIGVGLEGILELAHDKMTGRPRLLVLLEVTLGATVLVPQLVFNFSFADRSHETQAREQWTRMLAGPIPQNAILVSNDRDEMMPLWYIQYVENTRRDVLGLFPLITPAPEHANVVRLTDSLLNVRRPIFFVKPMPGLDIKYRLDTSASPLVRVIAPAVTLLPQYAADAHVADSMQVIGYSLTLDPAGLRVAVYWQPTAKLTSNYTGFVQLVDANGVKVAQGNDHQLGGDYYPTSMWNVGEYLRDEQHIPLPTGSPSGPYHLLIGMYRQPDMEPLGNPVELGSFFLQ